MIWLENHQFTAPIALNRIAKIGWEEFEDTKGAIVNRRTGNTTTKKKDKKNPQTKMIYKKLQWKLKIEQHEPHQKQRACTQVTRKGNLYMREIIKCRNVEINITTIRSLLWKTICATIVIMCVYSNCWFSMEKHQLSCSIILYFICFDIFKPWPWV